MAGLRELWDDFFLKNNLMIPAFSQQKENITNLDDLTS
jgi:hypothetical protein